MTPEKLKKFLAYYRKRIREDPTNVEARLRLATVFREMGQSHRAIQQYEEAAQLLDEQGLALEAIAACKAILELDPSRIEAQYFLARLYAQTPDATDQSARVAQPVEPAEESPTHELDPEADQKSESEQRDLPEPEVVDEPIERPEREGTPDPGPTEVADYDEFEDEPLEGDDGGGLDGGRLELTDEEMERREGFSREEMQELLTTIDVDADDIVEMEDIDEYEDDDFEGLEEPVAGTDVEAEDELAIRETDEFDPDDEGDDEELTREIDNPAEEPRRGDLGQEGSDARYEAGVSEEKDE